MAYQNYRDLRVWQQAMDLCVLVCKRSDELPGRERFGLTQQLRKAAVSVPSNIAEGHTRGTPAEIRRYGSIAAGSLAEVETQIILAERIFSLSETGEIFMRMEAIRKMLFRLGQSYIREDFTGYSET